MKIGITICLLLWLIFAVPVVMAETTPTPQPEQKNIFNFVNKFESKRDPNFIIDGLTRFYKAFDNMFGGFIFSTPDVFADKLVLKNGDKKIEIDGLSPYRQMFYNIAIPLIAVVIAFIALGKIGSESQLELREFVKRVVITGILLIVAPVVLSLTIHAVSLLNDEITRIHSGQRFLDFAFSYLDKAKTAAANPQGAADAGVPDFTLNLLEGILNPTEFIFNIIIFLVTFIFLTASFIYIAFQSVYRFATLVFLSTLFPVVMPFYLSERSESIVYTYFKIWFTALLWQPAFILGFLIATKIFASILTEVGPNVGVLFFYAGFMFFLGNVNTIVSRIFADAISSVTASIQSGAAASIISGYSFGTLSELKRGMFGGGVSGARSWAGRQLGSGIGIINRPQLTANKQYNADSMNEKMSGFRGGQKGTEKEYYHSNHSTYHRNASYTQERYSHTSAQQRKYPHAQERNSAYRNEKVDSAPFHSYDHSGKGERSQPQPRYQDQTHTYSSQSRSPFQKKETEKGYSPPAQTKRRAPPTPSSQRSAKPPYRAPNVTNRQWRSRKAQDGTKQQSERADSTNRTSRIDKTI